MVLRKLVIAPLSEQLRVLAGVASSSDNEVMMHGKAEPCGSSVRELRAANGLTQEQLAARCQAFGWDVTRGTLAKIEAGVRRLNDAEVVVLAKCLKVGIMDLLGGFPAQQALSVTR